MCPVVVPVAERRTSMAALLRTPTRDPMRDEVEYLEHRTLALTQVTAFSAFDVDGDELRSQREHWECSLWKAFSAGTIPRRVILRLRLVRS